MAFLDATGLAHLWQEIKARLNAKANASHTHALDGTSVTGTLPLTKGGTGATTAAAARSKLGLGALATKGSVSLSGSDTTGTLPISKGGTGGTDGPEALKALGILDLIYPVGSIYMSAAATDPKDLLGGTWKQIGGRFLIGAGSNEANTTDWWGSYGAGENNFPAGEMGGEPKHTLSIGEMPSHGHGYWRDQTTGSPQTEHGAWEWHIDSANQFTEAGTHLYMEASDAGGGEAHNNMPPYYVVYIWQRTA